MDSKNQAVLFYKSLATADAFSCTLLARGARIQRGRAAALELKIIDLQKKNLPAEVAKLQAEADKRKALAVAFDKLDETIDKAIDDRAVLDQNQNKFK